MSKLISFLLILAQCATVGCVASLQVQPQRPQEPKPPYPYSQEQVSFENAAAGVQLEGTLTLPNTKGPFPVVVLLHGSAPLDRDETIFGHKPFLVLAHHLTQRGIAVLRFDKRGAGKSTGRYDTSNLEDFTSDALAGVEYLRTRKEINAKQIGLIGHSEGGLTAPQAASKSTDIAFIVLMAGPCITGEQIMYAQSAMFQRTDGVKEEEINRHRQFLQQAFAIVKTERDPKVAEQQLRLFFIEHFDRCTEKYFGPMEGQISLFNSTWFRYFLTYDPVIALRQVTVPVLAINGDLDLCVSSTQNLTRISDVLKQSGNVDFTTVQLAKLNHYFQTCQTGLPSEFENIEETIAPCALDAVSEWILSELR